MNVKYIYDACEPTNRNVNLEITEFNIEVFELLNKVLQESDKRVDYEFVFFLFLRLVKRSSQEADVSAADILNVLDEDSKELLKEFKSKTDPLRSLVYLIGTNSEIPQNYTMTERMIIIAAIARLRGINLIF